jgi:hypothetical protein
VSGRNEQSFQHRPVCILIEATKWNTNGVSVQRERGGEIRELWGSGFRRIPPLGRQKGAKSVREPAPSGEGAYVRLARPGHALTAISLMMRPSRPA